MAQTSWINELAPGNPWLMGQSDITMGMATYDDMTVYMGSIGLTTSWTLEDK